METKQEEGLSVLFFTDNEEPDESFYAATLDEAIQVCTFKYSIDPATRYQLRTEFVASFTDTDGVMHSIEIHTA